MFLCGIYYMVKEGGTSTVAAGFMPLTLLALAGQAHGLSSRVRDKAVQRL